MSVTISTRRTVRFTRASRRLLIACLAFMASGCSTLGYYLHVAEGESAVLARRVPVSTLISDPNVDADLRARLESAQAARRFASDHLDLPRNRSYTSYVALKHPYVAWNVFATPEFSVVPITHCFPFAGCVAYLGFFDQARAERAARKMAGRGNDTRIEGVAAYSTLGWFADPILSSMMRWSDDELDAVIFHELAHQKIYVKNDTAFNESYATFVQKEGLREWRASRGLPSRDDATDAHDAEFTQLVLDLRERLRTLYASGLAEDRMRTAKQREIAAFRERYAELRDGSWNGDRRWDAWMARPINNASLVPFGLYDRWVPAFARLFEQSGRQWPAFLARVGELASRPAHEREAILQRLETER